VLGDWSAGLSLNQLVGSVWRQQRGSRGMKGHGHKTLDCSMAFVIMQVWTGKASTR
jgi:hypothetical protein